MVSFSKVCLLLVLAAARVAAQEVVLEENTVEPTGEESTVAPEVAFSLCDGDALLAVSNGCTDSEACKLAAEDLGLQIGGVNEPFVGNWADKGCYYYPSDHPLYPNQAYFGEQGTCAELRMQPAAGAMRVSCNGSTIPPFDPERCPGDLCIDAEGCEVAANAMGLELGSAEWPFSGNYIIKGCVFYPASDPLYANQAYWGEGASICGQLRAEPTDGSLRIQCTGDEMPEVEAEVGEDTELDEATSAAQTTEAPELDEATSAAQTTEAPVATPITADPLPSNATEEDTINAINATAPASAPVIEDEDDEDDQKNDKNDKMDDGPGNTVSALESDAISSASSKGVHVFFLLSAIISFFSSNL